jgi:uncharacterized protein YcfJ
VAFFAPESVVTFSGIRMHEEDVDDDGKLVSVLRMKSDRDRQDQTDYVEREILGRAEQEARELLDAEVLTISVAYAEAYGEDPVKLHDSGLSPLFAKLTALTRSCGVTLKQDTPLNNLRAFVDTILTIDPALSVDALRADLTSLEDHLAQQRTQLAHIRAAVTGRVLQELNPRIEQEVLCQREQRDMQALQRVCSTLTQSIVARHVAEAVSEILTDTQTALNAAVRFKKFKKFPEFRDLTEEFELSNADKVRPIGGSIGGVIGGLIGFYFGGPVGSAAGAFIGNSLGAEAGEHLADPTIVTVQLGDNAHEVSTEAIHITSKEAKKAIAKSFEQLELDFLIKIEFRLRDIHAALNRFESVLIQEVRP